MAPLTYLVLVLGLGILAQLISWRLKLPSILLLLAFGFGLSATTNVTIDDYLDQEVLLAIVGLFVAIILFEGGLTLKFSELREAGVPVLRLCSLGVAVSAVLTAVLAHYIFYFDWTVASLLGAILVVTGPNDEINSLATREFSHIFGKANVWQIAPQDKDSHHMKSVASHRRGRVCFSNSPTYPKLHNLARDGAIIKKTQITDVFTLQDFDLTYGEDAIILFLQDENRNLRPAPADLEKLPPNTTIYALIIPKDAENPSPEENHLRGS